MCEILFESMSSEKMFSSYITTFLILYSCVVYGRKCLLDDQQCITAAMRRIYPIIMAGDECLDLDSTELTVKDIVVTKRPNLNYICTKLQMYGMADCKVDEARFNLRSDKWHMKLRCPQLKLQMHCDCDGHVASERFDSHGPSELILEDYNLVFNGELDQEDRIDGETYIQLTKFDVTQVKSKERDSCKFNFLSHEEESHRTREFLNERWQELYNQAQIPGMHRLMGVLIEQFNQYFDKVPVSEVFMR